VILYSEGHNNVSGMGFSELSAESAFGCLFFLLYDTTILDYVNKL